MRCHLVQHGVDRHKVGAIQGGDVPAVFHHEIVVSVLWLNGILQLETPLPIDANPKQIKALVLAVEQKGVHLGDGYLDGQVLRTISNQEESGTGGVLQVAMIAADAESGETSKRLNDANTQTEEQGERASHRSIEIFHGVLVMSQFWF